MENSIPFKDWHIVREIGRGSYGRVYEIERDFYGKTLKSAMKVIPIPTDEGALDNLYGSGFDEKSVSTWCRQRLNDILGEYSLMESLKGYTNIVGVEDVEVVERTDSPGYYVYIRMELLTSLQRRLREKDFSEEDVIKLGKDICQALVVCEQHKIIHRDIKPENIMVSEHGDYKLGDFGVARQLEHTMSATVAGTERYMAPEIIKREKYGRDVDTYSLGVVMYRLLNKRTMPFMKIGELPTAEDVSAAQARRLSGEPFPAPAEGSKELVRIVLKACSFDRAKRYSSAADMLSDLEALPVAAEEQIPDPVIYEPAPKKKPAPSIKPEPEPEPEDEKTLPMLQNYVIGMKDKVTAEGETMPMFNSHRTFRDEKLLQISDRKDEDHPDVIVASETVSQEQAGKNLNATAKSSKASLILYIGSIAAILIWILRPIVTVFYGFSDMACVLALVIGTIIFGAGMQRRNWTDTFTGRMMVVIGCILFIFICILNAINYVLDWSDYLALAPWAAAVLTYGIVWFIMKLRLPERTEPAWAAYSSKLGPTAFRNIAIIIVAVRAVLVAIQVHEYTYLDMILYGIPVLLILLLIIGVTKRNKAVLLSAFGGLIAAKLYFGIQRTASDIEIGAELYDIFDFEFSFIVLIPALVVLFYELLKGPDKKTHIRIAIALSLFTLYLGNSVTLILSVITDGGTIVDAVKYYGTDMLDAALFIMFTVLICSRKKELLKR